MAAHYAYYRRAQVWDTSHRPAIDDPTKDTLDLLLAHCFGTDRTRWPHHLHAAEKAARTIVTLTDGSPWDALWMVADADQSHYETLTRRTPGPADGWVHVGTFHANQHKTAAPPSRTTRQRAAYRPTTLLSALPRDMSGDFQ